MRLLPAHRQDVPSTNRLGAAAGGCGGEGTGGPFGVRPLPGAALGPASVVAGAQAVCRRCLCRAAVLGRSAMRLRASGSVVRELEARVLVLRAYSTAMQEQQ
ncbi:MAG: hypothetical protein KDA90_20225, partial [Planctomycetaceae bacterium]|nr:hypothetical protein [Planctomycetaceae bacterium]